MALFLCPAFIVWQAAHATTPTQGQPPAAAGQNPQNQDGVEIEARGQLHEAFASPSVAKPTAAPIVTKKPPEPVNELPPDQKPEGENVQWIPGYWMWDEDRTDFLWVSGTWRAIPPEKRWLPGYWVDADGGYRWVSGYWMADAETQVNLQPEPPAPIEEAAPVYNETTQTYVPGIWVYRDNRYWWRPGFAINQHPGWVWTPASYRWTPGGYAFVDGYWDYDLNRRGMAFAPVYINAQIYSRPNWFYRPRYVISTDFLLGSLFVNVGWNHYYFGDYYDNRYSRLGYSPWVNYRFNNRYYDPLYSYYRWHHRGDDGWERNMQNGFNARRDGSMQRPGRTLAQLEKSGTGEGRPGTTANALVSIDQWKGDNFKLQRQPQRDDRTVVDHFRNISKERSRNESGSRTSMYPPDRVTGKEAETGRRETLPGRKDNPPGKDSTPPTKQSTPPAERKETRPGNSDAPGKAEGSRYDLPKSNQTYRRPAGQQAPPERPKQPPAQQQHNPGKGSGNPGKGSDKPGK